MAKTNIPTKTLSEKMLEENSTPSFSAIDVASVERIIRKTKANAIEELCDYDKKAYDTFTILIKELKETEQKIKGQIRTMKHLYTYIKLAVLLNFFDNKKEAKIYANIVTNWFLYKMSNPKLSIYKLINSQLSMFTEQQANRLKKDICNCFDIMARSGDFDCFLIALEWNKRAENQFYMPRRNIFLKHNIIQSLQDLYDGKINKLGISMPPRTGKAQPLTSKLVTPNGYVNMGDICVGDLVATKNGTFTKVLNIYPQGLKDVYKVTFSDGTYTECCKEHLWTVQNKEKLYKTLSLEEIINDLSNGNKYTLEYCNAVQFEKKHLDIDPYLLGCLIRGRLFGYGNFIPKEYLTSSIEDRISILKGLFNYDKKHIKFSTLSKQLVEDVLFIVQSLGGKAKVNELKNRNKYLTSIYIISIYIPNSLIKTDKLVKKFASIEYIGKKECQCIMVEDSSHLYLTDNFIVTHNTGIAKLFVVFNAFKDLSQETFAVSYGDKVIKKFYHDILNFFENKNDYRLNAIFNNAKIEYKNADDYYIDVGGRHPYPTFAFSSLYGSNTGTVEASRLFYADDLVKDFVEANNPQTLNNTWEQFISSSDDRVLEGCSVLLIGTMWGTNCPLSRYYELYKDDVDARFLKISCYDENGKSNFLYNKAGSKRIAFSTTYWKDKEKKNDPVIFAAKYLANPIERDGRDFDKLQYYTELPERKPDLICSAVDVAVVSGGDNLSAPIAYVYEKEKEIYITDLVYSNKGTEFTLPRLVDKIINNKIEKIHFEEKEGATNKAINYGLGETVKKLLLNKGYKTNITSKSAAGSMSKTARIGTYQTDIAGIPVDGHYVIYFKDKSLRNSANTDDREYNNFIFDLRNYSSRLKNQIDDAPDSLATLLAYCIDVKPKGEAQCIKIDWKRKHY